MDQNQQSSPKQQNNQTSQIPPSTPNVQPPPVQPPSSPQPIEPPIPIPTPPPPAEKPAIVPPLSNEPDTTQTPPKSHPKTIFYILLILVVIITLAALSMIFLNFAGFNNTQPEEQASTQLEEVQIPEPTVMEEDEDIKALQNQGNSDEVSDIEKDLKNTDFTNLDKELNSISSEINQ